MIKSKQDQGRENKSLGKSDLEMVHLWQINAMETQQALQFVMQLSH